MGESPAKASEESGRDDEDKATEFELDLAGDHEYDTDGHGGYDQDKTPSGLFKAEQESEDEDES